MIRLLFFLRFKSQLYRTAPEMMSALESSVVQIFNNAGGDVKSKHRLLTVSFDEASPGIWLDIFILIEKVIAAMEGAGPDLYGYSLVIGKDIPQGEEERICHLLSLGPEKNHVYCDPEVRKSLAHYACFEEVPPDQRGEIPVLADSFFRITEFRLLPEDRADNLVLKETILGSINEAGYRNLLILGPPVPGKRRDLYAYCEKFLGDCPPLAIRFGGRGFSPLSDALSPRIRAFIEKAGVSADILKEMDGLGETIFRERLRTEVPPAQEQRGRRFFKLFLETYITAVELKNLKPLIILENIHQANPAAAAIFQDTFREAGSGKMLVFGTAGDSFLFGSRLTKIVKGWEEVFPRVFRLDAKSRNSAFVPDDIPPDLWEIACVLDLLGRYFPEEILGQLLEEGGKSPQMISRALEMLVALGVSDQADLPLPQVENFSAKAEPFLGERKHLVQALVRRCLLNWVSRHKIGPCFGLLAILVELGHDGTVSTPMQDELVFKSVNADLANGAHGEIRRAITQGSLGSVVGPQRAFTVDYLFKSTRVLLHGTEGQIREVFRILPQVDQLYPPYRAKILANISSFHLGLRDSGSALTAVKEAVMLSQNRPWSGLAQSCRLFSLVNLSKRRIGETLEYASFAVENAERSDTIEERGITSYYAAAAQSLLGNFALALRFAEEAEIKFAAAGQFEWVDYARFFRGRLAFDLGCYREAGDIFEGVRTNPAGISNPVKQGLLTAWSYRSRIYSQDSLTPKPEGGGIDGDLFEIEATYFAEDYEWAAELATRFSSALPQEYFLFTEQPDWHSGFAQNELLLLHPVDFWSRMISVYRALALCRLSPADQEEALRIMQRILRDERLAETDPEDAFYFYAWYQVLEKSGAAQSDMNTALSMAFKRLQSRASRIDDPETRKLFLSQPRWNGALCLAAKEYKLI